MLLHVVFDNRINMVFNEVTMIKHTDLHPDSKIIDRLGGPAKLAELLGYDKTHGGVQRIQNWKKRGIPAEVKIKYPELFMTDLIDRIKASDDTQPPVGSGPTKKDKLARLTA